MKLQQITLSLISVAFAMMIGCGGQNSSAPRGELSNQLTSQESLQIQRSQVQQMTRNRTRPSTPSPQAVQPLPSSPSSSVGWSQGGSLSGAAGCTGSSSVSSGASTSGYADPYGRADINAYDRLHPQESTRYLLDSQVDSQASADISIRFTQNHFYINVGEDVFLEGSWREINDHTLEISFDGYTVHVDVQLDGDSLDFEEIPSEAPAVDPSSVPCSYAEPFYPAADTRNAGRYPIPSPTSFGDPRHPQE